MAVYKRMMSVSPHIKSDATTSRVMKDVIIALVPSMLAMVLIFGFYPLMTMLISVVSCVCAEYLFCVITKQKCTLNDYSAVVTGVILAMNLPPVVPFYVPLIGGFFAIMVVKMLFGGLGKNFANPALTARIFLMLAWAGTMTKFVAPIDLSKGFGEMFKYFGAFFGGVDSLPGGVDVLTTATPLAQFKINDFAGINITNAFLGNIGGCAGEVSSLALIIGGVYLIVRKVIDYKIPLLFLGTVAVLTPLFNMSFASILPALFSGGLMLGAFFMATDYTTSPNTTLGIIIYSIGCGFFTVLFREFSSMTEGVSFAILIMNIVTPLLDKFIIPKPFGYVKVKKEKVKKVKVEKAKEEVK